MYSETSNIDLLGTKERVLIVNSHKSGLRELWCIHVVYTCIITIISVLFIERCPPFQSVLLRGFCCVISADPNICLSLSLSLSPTQQSSMLVAHTSMDQAGDGSITGVVGTSLYLAPELFRPSTVKYTQVQQIKHMYTME